VQMWPEIDGHHFALQCGSWGCPTRGRASARHRDAAVPGDWSEPMRDLLMVILAILVVLDVRMLMSEYKRDRQLSQFS
jgi:hypothetical protein